MIFVDAHVHIYDCFDLEIFFDSAFANFQKEAGRRGQQNTFTGILLLTETSKDNWFEHLKSYAGNKGGNGNKAIGNWTFHRTNENCSLYVQSSNGQGLFLIAGRQIVTAENLELLALGTARNFKDGSPVEELIEEVKERGGIPMIPWGVGKWLGKRGRIVKNILERKKGSLLFLGDNGGRPNFLPLPSHFKKAEKKGIRVLPGSDPLPFPSQCIRPGSFGFSAEGAVSTTHPARDIIRILLDPTNTFQSYGQPEPFLRFFRNQLLMQIIKRRCSS